jgi:alkanesulfonate monooxygenase SsuD/methylene tetrahydromethanopterin reductase-like flavin-dependent oxidoreductase (luciferase family)
MAKADVSHPAGTTAQPPIRVGYRLPQALLEPGRFAELRYVLKRAEEIGVDHLCTGDHVSFHGGTGFDGLVQATAFAVLTEALPVHTSVYLLSLRHPVLVARQLASLTALAPGRVVFGVGIGGEDRAEVAACGVDPRTRGHRMDESLKILRELLAGRAATLRGSFFDVDAVRILPVPEPPIPILVGGRSGAAVTRTARFGDGWLGLWVSPQRFATVTGDIEQAAAALGRDVHWQHGLTVWCGFGPSPGAAIPSLAETMERLYCMPFSTFARYCPSGSPQEVAASMRPYVEAGCRSFNVIGVAGDPLESLEATAEVRHELNRGIAMGARRPFAPSVAS